MEAKAGWAAAQSPLCVVVLTTELTDELIREGLARDLVRNVQEQRKSIDCQYTDRIEIGVMTVSRRKCEQAIEENRDYIMNETLAVDPAGERAVDVANPTRRSRTATCRIFLRVVTAKPAS